MVAEQMSQNNDKVTATDTLPHGDYVLFIMGASAREKRYPIRKCFVLAQILERAGLVPVFVAGSQDDDLKREIKKTSWRFFGSLTIAEFTALFVSAKLAIGNDSVLMRLAAAVGAPSIHFLSFPGSHGLFTYDEKRHRILLPECGWRDGRNCRDCKLTCIGKIRLGTILRCARDLTGVNIPEPVRIAYFTQDNIGDVLVWVNHVEALFHLLAPCVVTVFATRMAKALLENYTFAEEVVEYNPGVPWTQDECEQFGRFDLIFNSRYDADSLLRVRALDHGKAYGFENVDIPEAACLQHYDGYVPLSTWDDFRFRRETSVTEQGAELIRLICPNYRCQTVVIWDDEYVRDLDWAQSKGGKRVVFILGASDRSKHWGTANYTTLAKGLSGRGYKPLFLLGPGEKDYSPTITDAGFDVEIGLSFSRVAALFSRSLGTSGVIGNDTGLMHLACILGTPSLTIMPNGTQFTWFPYQSDTRARHLFCSPSCAKPMCSQDCPMRLDCIKMISVEQVTAAANSLLS